MKTLGRSDKGDFPLLKLKNLKIKMDTGAYTSSIHCQDIKEVEIEEKTQLQFKLLDPSHPKFNNKLLTFSDYETKEIKSSFGDVEERYVIKTIIVLFSTEYTIELSLSNRNDMKFPVLIGRKFLNKIFVVDTSLKNLSFETKQLSKEKK